eukprot:TRINITY_DN956_c0_g1_i1.p1 TRINITY_DN956_c0_g1~~TRINITY_DN956_c0_g1_i1.p1  ORF type:complete len:491 (+),score=48.00 TRINITY_DN956_c0_g1_i1:210-1682(+)
MSTKNDLTCCKLGGLPDKKLRKDIVILTMWVSEGAEERGLTWRDESPFSVLDPDQVHAILQYLPLQALLCFGMTCKRNRELADSDALWSLICKREWGDRAVEAWPVGRYKVGWKRLYRQMLVLGGASWSRVRQGNLHPAPRASHSMNVLAGKIVVFGGGCAGGRDLDDVWVANLPEDPAVGLFWNLAGSGAPSGRFGHSCNVVGDSLVMFGGINDKASRHNDTWVFTSSNAFGSEERFSGQLLDVAVAPPARGAHAACCPGDGKLVVFGGIGSDGVRLSDTWILDSMNGHPLWHQLTTPVSPAPRSGHSLTWIGGKRMVLFGGRGVGFDVMNDVWLLDLEVEWPTWVELCPTDPQPHSDLPAARAGHSATNIFGGRVLVFGGEDAKRARKADAWVLDPSVNWYSRNAGCIASNNNRRSSDSGGNRLSRRFWKKLKQWGPAPSRRSFHAACAVEYGHAVLIFGGMVDGELAPQPTAGLGFDGQLHLLQLIP